ncbi:hypothetical protein LCGC14_2513500 [marine sediment metagenome]|uniref:Uncharacterized protein n=1 Tax=marine sediment metagenome TaxID=412755 RepID=A0A0F9DRT8_9ZZZZ
MYMYESEAKLIKRKAFWYFLLRGIFLKKIKITIASKHGSSYNDKVNYDWWPKSYGDTKKVCFNANKLGIADLLKCLDKKTINGTLYLFYLAYKRAIKRRKNGT